MTPSICLRPERKRLTLCRIAAYSPGTARAFPARAGREEHDIALLERHHFRARLYARTLLRHHELAAANRARTRTAARPSEAETRVRRTGLMQTKL